MPFYERGPVRIRYEEVGSGFPLMVIPGGGLNSALSVSPVTLAIQSDGTVQGRLPLHWC